jgi:hypothetical protein
MKLRPVHSDDIRAQVDPARAIRMAQSRGQPIFYAYCKATRARTISLSLLADLDKPGTYYASHAAPRGSD